MSSPTKGTVWSRFVHTFNTSLCNPTNEKLVNRSPLAAGRGWDVGEEPNADTDQVGGCLGCGGLLAVVVVAVYIITGSLDGHTASEVNRTQSDQIQALTFQVGHLSKEVQAMRDQKYGTCPTTDEP